MDNKEPTTSDLLKNFNSYKFSKITYYQVQSHKKLSDKIRRGKCECIRDVSLASKKSLILYKIKSAIENASDNIFFDKKEIKLLYRKISSVKSNNLKISTEAVWKSRRIISDYNLCSEEYYYEED